MHKSGFKKEKQKMENIMYTSTYDSAIGSLLLAADDIGLVGLWLNSDRFYTNLLANREYIAKGTPILQEAKRWLNAYFSGHEPKVEVPLHLIGTPFRQEVWKLLLQIPYGQVATYGDLAKKMAEKRGVAYMSAQAIGGAVGHNEISIIIPCHRVIGANGNLTGYAGGIDKKLKLLELEGVDTKKLFLPKNYKAVNCKIKLNI